MDVKVFDVKTSFKELIEGNGLESLLDALKRSLTPPEPVKDEELAKARESIRTIIREHLAPMRMVLDRGVNAGESRESISRSDTLYLGQAHAYLNTAGLALDHVKDLLEEALKDRKHDRECPCVDKEEKAEASERPTDAPPKAPEGQPEQAPGASTPSEASARVDF